MIPNELTQDLTNYKNIGSYDSIQILLQEEEALKIRKKVLGVLTIIESLTDMVNNKEFTKARSASVYIDSDGEVELELWKNVMADEANSECDAKLPEYVNIKNAFYNTSNHTGYFQGAFDLTLSGLEELKKSWLGEEMCIFLEKTAIAEEITPVSSLGDNKKTNKIKI